MTGSKSHDTHLFNLQDTWPTSTYLNDLHHLIVLLKILLSSIYFNRVGRFLGFQFFTIRQLSNGFLGLKSCFGSAEIVF